MKSEFKTVFLTTKSSDDFFRFLQVIFHLYPEDKFHHLIAEKTKMFDTDEAIYLAIQTDLSKIKPFLSELTFALPALKKQKKEMAKQVLEIVGAKKQIDGYLEIGSTGRYISELKKHVRFSKKIYLTNDIAPTNGIGDLFERGQFRKIGQFSQLDYHPITNEIADESLDLVCCHIGLHHCPENLLHNYLLSIKRVLKKGGLFILRDHDVKTNEMDSFVSLVHTVFNLGLGVQWETNNKEYKSFRSIENWVEMIEEVGFKDLGKRILQDKDPSANTLVGFIKN